MEKGSYIKANNKKKYFLQEKKWLDSIISLIKQEETFLPSLHYLSILVSCFKTTQISITYITDQIHIIVNEYFTQPWPNGLAGCSIIPYTRKVVGLILRSSAAISVGSLPLPIYEMWLGGGMCLPHSLMFSGRGLLRLMVTRRLLKPICSLLWSLLQMLSVDPILCARLCATLKNGFWKMSMF